MTKKVPQVKKTTRAKSPLRDALKEVYRTAIIDAARQVFVASGFDDARVADTADMAGVSVGTLYNYFPNKDALICAVAQIDIQKLLERLNIVDEVTDPLERLEAYVKVAYAFLQEHPYLATSRPEVEKAVRDSGIPDPKVEFARISHRTFCQIKKEGYIAAEWDLGLLAAVFDGITRGLIDDWMASGAKGPLEDRAILAVTLLLNGVGNPAKPRSPPPSETHR